MKREEPRVRFGRIYFEAAGFFCVGRGVWVLASLGDLGAWEMIVGSF